jgi:anaerobic carbon-monoxide dehydrogenase iron sulfur subunit
MRKVLFIRPSLCVNCRICEMACSLAKTGMFNPVQSRIWIHQNEEGRDIPMTCRHCLWPPCEKACPVVGEKAIYQDEQTGIVYISSENCLGCYDCVRACPFDAIRINAEEDQVFKCDLCGGDPECAKWCPTESIKYVEQSIIGTLSAIDRNLPFY